MCMLFIRMHYMAANAIRYSLLLVVAVFACLVHAQNSCEDLRNTYLTITSASAQLGRTILSVDGSIGTDTSNCTVCRTLLGALEQGGSGNLTIHLAGGTLQLSSPLMLSEKSHIAILGNSSQQTVISCASLSTTDIAYPYVLVSGSNDILFANITFDGCGRNTSSVQLQESDQVVFQSCVFRNSAAPAVITNESTSVFIVSSVFLNNAQGFECTASVQLTPIMLLVENSLFVGNNLPSQNKFGDRGGAMRIDIESSSASKVCISGSEFTNNSAPIDGGAVYLLVANVSNGAEIYVNASTFTNNSCSETGGAIYIDIDGTFKVINISKSNFTKNNATVGGGVAIVALSGQANEAVSIVNSSFTGNGGVYDGTALGIISLTGSNEIGLSIGVSDCKFTSNIPRTGGDRAAIVLSQSLLTFRGNNDISRNTGGGITLFGSRMDVRGSVTFFGNEAVLGGGCFLTGKSLILLYDGSNLTFANNTASQAGGGLYVKTTSSDSLFPVRNKNCFIQYFTSISDIPPSKWNTRVEFSYNAANLMGAAIYATDFTQCAWLGNDNAITTRRSAQYIFTPNNDTTSPFIIRGNKITSSYKTGQFTSEDFASEARNLSVSVPLASTGKTQVSSGEVVSFVLHATDQFGNRGQAIWTALLPNNATRLGAVSAEGGAFTYAIPPQEHSNSSNILISVGLNGIKNSFTSVPFAHHAFCHPGYEPSVENNATTCKCKTDQKIVLRCDDRNRYIYVNPGIWVNYTSDDTLYQGRTIPWYLECKTLGNLPGCLFKYDDVDAQCGPNRKGVLCSECREGYGVTLDLQSCESNCGVSGPGFYVYIILYCIGVPILTLAILYFDVKVPNELKGFIFYAQVIGLIYRDSDRQTNVSPILSVLYNILGFTTAFPFCFFEGMSPLLVAFFGIVPYILSVIAMVAYLLCANVCNSVSSRLNYGYHGFYFMFLFMYKYFLDFGYILISCRNVEQIGTTHIYTGKSCFNFPYTIYFIIGMLIVLVFSIGVPIYVLHLIYRRKRAIHVYNAISYGFKEGNKYAWYGIWDIWRRIPFVALTSVTIVGPTITLFIYAALTLFILIVTSVAKPYKEEHVNVIELLITLCLFFVTISELDATDVYVTYTVGQSFALAPYFFVIFFIIWKFSSYIGVCRFCRKKLHVDEKSSVALKSFVSDTSTLGLQEKETDQYEDIAFEYQLYEINDGETEMDNSIEPREPLLESQPEPERKCGRRKCSEIASDSF